MDIFIGTIIGVILLYKLLDWVLYEMRSKIFRVRRRRLFLGDRPQIIVTIPTLYAFRIFSKRKRKEFFAKDIKRFFSMLKAGKVYRTETHDTIINHLKRLAANNIIEILGDIERTKIKSMLLNKVFILNTENIFEKQQFYMITFKVINQKA